MEIIRWSELSDANVKRKQDRIRQIFFETSSRRNFSDAAAKEDFWNKWTSYYFVHEPERILLAIENGEAVGYLTGAADSLSAAPYISKSNPSYEVFADQFKIYPAHLHINFTAGARGKGYGRGLIDTFITDLKKLKVGGVHVVTAPGADNVGFYKRSGFSFTVEREWNSAPLLFMGKSILIA